MMSIVIAFYTLNTWALQNRWMDGSGVEWIYVVNSDDTITIGNGYYAAIDTALTGSLTVPSTVAGRLVTGIGNYAFMLCGGVTQIKIPEGVSVIGNYAFAYCQELKSVALPSSLKNIGDSAFSGCDKLVDANDCIVIDGVLYEYVGYSSSVVLANDVIAIGEGAFESCYALMSVTLPEGLISIGKRAFRDCNSLEFIEIPANVERIADDAFDQCNGLMGMTVAADNVRYGSFNGVLYDKMSGKLLQCPRGLKGALAIPQFITSIGDGAFAYCSHLNEIDVPRSVTCLGVRAFIGCLELVEIVLPESVLELGESAFCGCDSLSSVELPSGLLKIPDKLLSGCCKLSKISFPTGVLEIGERAFEGCRSLGELNIPESVCGIADGAFSDSGILVRVEESNHNFADQDGVLYDKGLTRLIHSSNIKSEVIVPSSVTEIAPYAFNGCDRLQQVKLPEGLVRIGVHAFSRCPMLRCLTLPSTVVDISNMIASWVIELTSISFAGRPPAGVDMFVKHPADHIYYNSQYEQEWQEIIRTFNLLNAEPAVFVEGNKLAIPQSWMDVFPDFEKSYGFDYAKAVMMKTGKKDSLGNDMLVWQDYVAGTDPTKEDDVFMVSIALVNGEVRISYVPQLDDAHKMLRKYTIWGKKSLLDSGWSEVESGAEAGYNFFKATIEMR